MSIAEAAVEKARKRMRTAADADMVDNLEERWRMLNQQSKKFENF